MSRIKPMTEEEWRAVAGQVQACYEANSELRNLLSGRDSTKTYDKAIDVDRALDRLCLNLEEEMINRGEFKNWEILWKR